MALDKNDPSNPSLFHEIMDERWKIICDVAGGTEAMRKAGERLLPRHHMEPVQAYRERLDRAVFFNMFSLTVDYLVGRPFLEPVRLPENISDSMAKIAHDIDIQGNDLNQYCQIWFKTALQKGHSHTLIETPSNDGSLTLADQRDMNLRPYWVHIEPDRLIAAEAVRINGVETLTHIRFYESGVERDGYAEKVVEYIKQLEVIDPIGTGNPDFYRVELTRWRKMSKSDKWEEIERRITGLESISLVTFYTDREGFMISKPPLLDLAYLNISHWQSESDQLATLTVSRFPMLAASGVTESAEDQRIVVGPHAMLTMDDPQGRFYYVEHQGAALAAGESHAAKLEAHMALYGAQLLKARPDRETATSRSLDESASMAPLQRMALSFVDAVNTALVATAKLAGEEYTGSIQLKTDFALSENEVTNLQTLVTIRKDREISRLASLKELKRRKVLHDDYDPDEDLKQIQKEQEDKMADNPLNANEEIKDNPNDGVGLNPARTE